MTMSLRPANLPPKFVLKVIDIRVHVNQKFTDVCKNPGPDKKKN